MSVIDRFLYNVHDRIGEGENFRVKQAAVDVALSTFKHNTHMSMHMDLLVGGAPVQN